MGVDRRYHRPPGLTLSWIGDALRAAAQDIGARVPLDDADLTVLRNAASPATLDEFAERTGASRLRLLALIRHGLLVAERSPADVPEIVPLPPPRPPSAGYPQVLLARRSVRDLRIDQPVALAELSTILDLSLRTHGDKNSRCSPSAGRCYPLDIDVLARNVTDLEPGVYRYQPVAHTLTEPALRRGGRRADSLSVRTAE